MFDTLKIWWIILAEIGPISRAFRRFDTWLYYLVVETLGEEGLFDYLEEPRNYGQIIAKFNFVDSSYTREVFKTLSSGQNNPLVEKDGRFRRNPAVRLPSSDDVAERVPASMRKVSLHEMAPWIPTRMRQQPIDFVHRFEEEGPALFSFDEALSARVYTALRKAAFAFIDEEELRGKRLLDVGCGSGRETAEIWLRLKGDVQIAAIDPVAGMLNLAEEQFPDIVSQSGHRDLPPLADANRPTFHLMSAMNLEFPDESFDAVFHSAALHWLPDPRQGIREIGRVLKPGGLVFGTQVTKPAARPYLDLIIRVCEDVSGFFWEEEFRRWYEQAGVSLQVTTPAGIFKGRKVAQ
jgi:ubiquinone/menaquinone biosynthesis C-methylase UbiE